MLAITGLVALVVAVLTGSTPLAVLVIGVAIAGIVLLLRDWREDRRHAGADASPGPAPHEPRDSVRGLSPDGFAPDISTDPAGPSSNARAD